MFYRSTLSAKEAVHSAREDTAEFGSTRIESEHLVLRFLREDYYLRGRAPVEVVRAFGSAISLAGTGSLNTLLALARGRLGRKRSHNRKRPFDPLLQHLIGRGALGVDKNHRLHSLACRIHRPRMWQASCSCRGVR